MTRIRVLPSETSASSRILPTSPPPSAVTRPVLRGPVSSPPATAASAGAWSVPRKRAIAGPARGMPTARQRASRLGRPACNSVGPASAAESVSPLVAASVCHQLSSDDWASPVLHVTRWPQWSLRGKSCPNHSVVVRRIAPVIRRRPRSHWPAHGRNRLHGIDVMRQSLGAKQEQERQ
jgi:hypothetical protein